MGAGETVTLNQEKAEGSQTVRTRLKVFMKVIDLYHFIPEVSSQNVICTQVCSLEQSYYSKVILKQNKKFVVLKSANKIKSRVFAKKIK